MWLAARGNTLAEDTTADAARRRSHTISRYAAASASGLALDPLTARAGRRPRPRRRPRWIGRS